ncbi:MAG: hypothetical protein JSV44_10975 [Candidatus Zixiibacteriota bacterium]|nr:MAG: hypothetical protein JSV44_10975 [candidate division Zixibacteria bacterium]
MMDRLKTRWIIFGGLFIVVTVSYLLRIKFESTASPEVQKSFTYLEELPEGSVIMVSFDHEASSLPEIRPLALAMLRHAFKNDLKIVGVSLFAEGTAIGYRLLTETAGESGKTYGADYVFLGFKPQQISAILGMGESIMHVFPEDYLGTPTDEIPMMRGIKNYEEIEMIVSIADGALTVHWIEYVGGQYDQPIMAALTAAMITTYDPYLASGQLYSVVGGLKGAAEYENLLGRQGGGNRGMTAQTTAHLYVITLIIIGNIMYFRARKAGRE